MELDGFLGVEPDHIKSAHEKMSARDNYCDVLSAELYEYETPSQQTLINAIHKYETDYLGDKSLDPGEKSLLIVTHPFYEKVLREHVWGPITLPSDNYVEIAESYETSLLNLVENIDHSKFDVILMDVPEFFAMDSSQSRELVEKGLVDKVVLTHYAEGTPLESEKERIPTGYNSVYIAGAYGEYCAKMSLDSVAPTSYFSKKDSDIQRFAIRDALLSFYELGGKCSAQTAYNNVYSGDTQVTVSDVLSL